MLPFPISRYFSPVHCDEAPPNTRAKAALSSLTQAVAAPETELKRWRKTFNANAKNEVNGEKWVTLSLTLLTAHV